MATRSTARGSTSCNRKGRGLMRAVGGSHSPALGRGSVTLGKPSLSWSEMFYCVVMPPLVVAFAPWTLEQMLWLLTQWVCKRKIQSVGHVLHISPVWRPMFSGVSVTSPTVSCCKSIRERPTCSHLLIFSAYLNKCHYFPSWPYVS